METANEYLSHCPHWKDCGEVLCSPWGFISIAESEVRGKKLLVVGLNDNRSKDDEKIDRRDSYSDWFKEVIEEEITSGRLKCLSILMPPIAHFLFGDGSPVTQFLSGNGSPESQSQALKRIQWCNMVSCCPKPASDSKVAPASNPSATMRRNCVKRLVEGERHELLHRLSRFQPTHVLIVGRVTEHLWGIASRPGTALSRILNKKSRPTISYAMHPSQRRYPRKDYWEHVYKQLSKEV